MPYQSLSSLLDVSSTLQLGVYMGHQRRGLKITTHMITSGACDKNNTRALSATRTTSRQLVRPWETHSPRVLGAQTLYILCVRVLTKLILFCKARFTRVKQAQGMEPLPYRLALVLHVWSGLKPWLIRRIVVEFNSPAVKIDVTATSLPRS